MDAVAVDADHAAEAIKAMFAEIASEQPDLRTADRGPRSDRRIRACGSRPGVWASPVTSAFRMPSVWFAEGHDTVAPVYLYRFDWATPMLRLLRIGAAHATELPYVWGNLVSGPQGSTFRLGGLKTGKEVSARMQGPLGELRHAGQARPGCPVSRSGRPIRSPTAPAWSIDGHDTVVNDIDCRSAPTWGSRGTELPLT